MLETLELVLQMLDKYGDSEKACLELTSSGEEGSFHTRQIPAVILVTAELISFPNEIGY